MRWEDVIGQDRVKQHLQHTIAAGRVPHAIMLCGAPGTGCIPLALAFARALLSDTEQSARLADTYQHPDLHFVFPTIKRKTSDNYIQQWCQLLTASPYFTEADWLAAIKAEREQALIYEAESQRVLHTLSLKSSMGGRKVLIVWQPEKMNAVCANKLLKLIEEPPEQTIIVFASYQPEKLLPTIQSRVQRINVPPLTEAEVAEGLTLLRGTSAERAAATAHLSRGSITTALALLDTTGAEREYFEYFTILMRRAYTRQVRDLRQWAFQIAELPRESQKAFLDFCCRYIRESFMYNFAEPRLTYMNEEEEAFASNFARFVNEDNVLSIMEELDSAARDIEQNVSSKMVFFDLALQMIIHLIPKPR